MIYRVTIRLYHTQPQAGHLAVAITVDRIGEKSKFERVSRLIYRVIIRFYHTQPQAGHLAVAITVDRIREKS